jgi:hypothetical protein
VATFDLQEAPGPARDAQVLAHLNAGDLDPVAWVPLKSEIAGHTGQFLVMADALKLGGVRFGAGAMLAQQLADGMGAMLLTPKLLDMMYEQAAVQIPPFPDFNATMMENSSWFVKHSGRIDAAIKAAGYTTGIVQTIGKPWMISNALLSHPGKAENYGWHLPPGTKSPWKGIAIYPSVTTKAMVIQQPGWAHGLDQADYSETVQLVNRWCVVDGVKRDLADVLMDPALSFLASHEGPLNKGVLRQPGVPQYVCKLPPSPTPQQAMRVLLQQQQQGGLCPMPPQPPVYEPPERTNWTIVAWGTAAIAAVTWGFTLALKHAGRAAAR